MDERNTSRVADKAEGAAVDDASVHTTLPFECRARARATFEEAFTPSLNGAAPWLQACASSVVGTR